MGNPRTSDVVMQGVCDRNLVSGAAALVQICGLETLNMQVGVGSVISVIGLHTLNLTMFEANVVDIELADIGNYIWISTSPLLPVCVCTIMSV
jgi:hypothetical protein